MYIHQLQDWPQFRWDSNSLTNQLAEVRHRQGALIGRMEALGFDLRQEAELATLVREVEKSSEIEGEILDHAQVRSSVARRLGMDIGGLLPTDRNVEGVVEMVLDATKQYDQPLTEDRLCAWHSTLFPAGRSGMYKILVGAWRDDNNGPMQVVSGPIGRERVYYEAPAAPSLAREMAAFLNWFNAQEAFDQVIRAAKAHLWFVTIHPFDDGNGRIGRALTDMLLARSEGSSQRFYSMSAQIRKERREYYDFLERAQRGTLDVTPWMAWFLGCLDRALVDAQSALSTVLAKAAFWQLNSAVPLNTRQRLMLNNLLDGFEGKLTSSKWAKTAKCSQDSAHRDILDLVAKGLLAKDTSGGRSTSYSLVLHP
ncbi:MAG: Fic family protein [Fimbriimonadaceae bacterium]